MDEEEMYMVGGRVYGSSLSVTMLDHVAQPSHSSPHSGDPGCLLLTVVCLSPGLSGTSGASWSSRRDGAQGKCQGALVCPLVLLGHLSPHGQEPHLLLYPCPALQKWLGWCCRVEGREPADSTSMQDTG